MADPGIDTYLAALPEEQRSALEKLRATIREAAPEAVEVLSYGVPAFKQRQVLVSYGAAKKHCSFYVMSTAVVDAHKPELSGYKLGKGSVQFTPESPIPAPLVTKLVRARLAEAGGVRSASGSSR
jgi:uncharacterized protein YdhG (YjbR/CyaY superfamily)